MNKTNKRFGKLSKILAIGSKGNVTYDAPLFRFNAARDEIKHEVALRTFNKFVKASQTQADQPLEYLLNTICYSELARLKVDSGPEEEIHSPDWWHRLARQVADMSENEKRQVLRGLIDDYAEDTAGTFDPNVFSFTTNIVPAFIGLCFKTQDISEWVTKPWHLREGFKQLRDLSERVVIEGEVERVRKLSDRGTIIVVPTHSSNMDSIMVGWGLHASSIPPVTYGAGKNLFMNPLMTYFMHNLGAYKVDRRINHIVYKDLLKTYSQVILERGFHSLFFPGGTRSRSNYIETDLKLGLLGTAVSAYSENLVKSQKDARIYLCPLTINYNLVLEAESLIKEYLKREGGARYFLENDQFNHIGTVFRFAFNSMKMHATTVLRFGEPMDPFGNLVDDDGESYDSRGRRVDPTTYIQSALTGTYVDDAARDRAYTRRTGEEIADSFLRNTVLQPSQVVAWALFEQIKTQFPEHDVYQILKAGSSVTVPWKALRLTVDKLCHELKKRQDQRQLRSASMIYDCLIDETIDEALNALQSYHTPPILSLTGAGILVSRLDLVYFYSNRVDSYDIDPASILNQVRASL